MPYWYLTGVPVRSRHNLRYYAMKVLNKDKIVRTKQVEHTNNEQQMLESVQHPFIINLWGTFQDPSNLYMVMDFVPGGELFTLLRRSNVSVQTFTFYFMKLIHHDIWTEISWARRQILCCRSCARSQSFTLPRYHISRSQTRKHLAEFRWTH